MKVVIKKPSLYLRVNGKLQEFSVGDTIEMSKDLAESDTKKWEPVKSKPSAKVDEKATETATETAKA